MNEFERKLYLKQRNIENIGAIIMPQVISIKTYFFFYFFTFFKCTSGLHKNNLSNQLSNSSTNFGLGIKQTEL